MSTIDPTRPGSSRRGFSGMTGFTVVALGQFFSLLGTSMTSVALTIWAWQVTGTATALAHPVSAGPSADVAPLRGRLRPRR